MNHTKLDAPKCNKKSSFLVECSYFIVLRSSYKNHSIIIDLVQEMKWNETNIKIRFDQAKYFSIFYRRKVPGHQNQPARPRLILIYIRNDIHLCLLICKQLNNSFRIFVMELKVYYNKTHSQAHLLGSRRTEPHEKHNTVSKLTLIKSILIW